MVDYEATQRKSNFVVGTFVVVAVAAFVWLIFVFGDMPMAITKLNAYPVYVHFPSVPGVQKNTPVQYCGYHIGKVSTVSPPRLREDEQGRRYDQVTLELLIENKFRAIPDYVVIELVRRGFGSSYIEFKVYPDMVPEGEEYGVIEKGGEYWGHLATANNFFPEDVQKKLEDLASKISKLADNANEILGDQKNQENIKVVLENLAVASEQANETLISIKEFSQQGKSTLANADVKMSDMTASVSDVAEQLNKALGEIRVTLNKINDGQGTAGKFINDGQLYENLLDSSIELQQALEQIKCFAAEARENGVKIKW